MEPRYRVYPMFGSYERLRAELASPKKKGPKSSKGELATATAKKARKKPSLIKVGLWDIDAHFANLYPLVERLNEEQSRVRFYEVIAGVPLGAVVRRDLWLAELAKGGIKHPRLSAQESDYTILAQRLFTPLKSSRILQKLDYMIGIVAAPIYDDDPEWVEERLADLFATWRERDGLVSIQDVSMYAETAGRSFEAAVGFLVLSVLACLVQDKDLNHEETRGCLFDYDRTREDLIQSLKGFGLCDDCRKIRFKKGLGPVLTQLLATLKDYKPLTTPASE